MNKRLAIITTHPIQYNAPFFKLLSKSKKVTSKVFYTWGEEVLQSKYDPGFNKTIDWDLPLLEGYEFEFLFNTSKDKGSHHYNGIINPGIIKKITEWHADAILVYGWKFQSHLKVLRYFKNKIPVWFRGDSTLLDEKKSIKNLFKNALLKWVYQHVDIAFFTGTNNRDYFLMNGMKPSQLIKAFHAIDNERFQNVHGRYSSEAIEWKEELKIRPGSIVFLFAGKLESKKGVHVLLEAFCSFKNENAHLIIVGNGPLEESLKRQYGSKSNITFLDFQNQMKMPVVYQLCDVFVLPSTGPGESWGLGINEAMASGKPVIASSNCGSATDLIKDCENGYIFKSGDVPDLVLKMQLIFDNKKDIDKWGQSSLLKINDFTFHQFIMAIENIPDNNG